MRASASPRAAMRRAADPRVFGGILIMAGSAYAGLVLLNDAPEAVLVAVAARDLPAGIALQRDDFTLREAVVEQPGRYLQQEVPQGTLSRPVGEGELIPRSSVEQQAAPKRLVAVPIEVERFPPHVQRGSRVDVWRAGGLQPVLRGAAVVSVADPDAWAGATTTVVLAVAEDDVAELLAATRAGPVDITGYQGPS